MPKYLINGKTIESEKDLTEDEIDEIASAIPVATKEEAIQNEQVAENIEKEKAGYQPSVVVGIPGAGVAIPVTPKRTQESVNKELETRQKQADKNPETEPSYAQIGAGLAAEIGIAESAKIAGTVMGAAVGGPAAPLTATIGYIGGAITGGASGSIAAQKIEGRPDINWGRVAVDSLINLVPGVKVGKSGTKLAKISGALAKRPIATTAGVGAVAGPTGLVAQEYYETGEIPETSKIVQSGLLGSTLGAGLGYTSQKAIPLLRRFAGKSSKEIQDLVNNGDSGAVAYVDALTANVDPKEFLTKENVVEFIGTLANTAKANIAPSKVIGPKATQAIRDAGNMVMAGQEVGGILGSRINDAILKSADPAATQKFALEYLTGQAKSVPLELKDLAQDLSQARKYIDEYQEGLLQMHYNGQRPLPRLLVESIESSKNEGDYITRSYAFFGDKEYFPSKQATEELMDDLITRTRIGIDNKETIDVVDLATGTTVARPNPNFGKEIELPPMSEKQAEKYIADLNAKKASNPDDVHNWIYTQNAGILKERKDLSPALRQYLGEYKTPGEQVSQTMSKLSRLVAYDKADFEISSALRELGLLKISGEGIEGLQPINLRRGPAKLGTEELYGPPEVQTALNHLYANGTDDATMSFAERTAMDAWQTSVSASKAAKTVFNPVSYATNFIYGPVNMAAMGMNPTNGLGTGAKFAAAQFETVAKRMPRASIDEFKKMKEIGVIPQGLTFADIQAGLQSGRIGSFVQKGISPAGKVYSGIDTANRVAAYTNYRENLTKQFPGAPSDLIEKQAADFTNNTFQNYDYVNKNIKTLSRYGVPFGQFATFTFELMRNQYNQGKLIKKMLDGSYAGELSEKFGVAANEKAIKNDAAKRLAGMIVVYGSTSIAAQQVLESVGITRDKERAYRESVLPDFAEKKPLLITGDPQTGEVRYMNLSYLIPQQQLVGPFMAGFNNRSFTEAMQYGLEGVGEDIIGEGSFTMNSLTQALNNYDIERGREISTAPDPMTNRIERTEFFVKDVFTPGFLNEIQKIKTQPADKTAQRLLGLRFNETTIDKGFGFRANTIKNALNTSRANISSARYQLDDGKISQQEFDSIYNQNTTSFRQNIDVLGRHVKNLKTIGLNEDQVVKLLRDNHIGAEVALAALDGETFDAPKVKRDTITDRYEEMLPLSRKDREAKIREIARQDRVVGMALRDKHREYLKDEKLKIGEKDRLVRSLGTNDGTRARHIFKKMSGTNDPNGVLKNYQRKGLVTPEVMLQIQQLQKNAQKSY